MTGKLADTVMSVRNGEQIARKYQPVVYNPSTPAQVEQRAKLKALSQLSAVVAPVIAFRRQGSVSSRNRFTKKNFVNVSFADDTASVNLLSVDLTGGVVALPALTVTRDLSSMDVALSQDAPSIDRVVYVVVVRNADNKLALGPTTVVEKEATGTFPWELGDNRPSYTLDCFVYAYGIRDNSEAARSKFGDLTSPDGETVAELIVSSSLLESDVTLTETVAASAPAPSE